MNRIIIEMILAGLFFGAWPLFMNRSGLNGIAASVVLGIISFTLILSFILLGGFVNPKWWQEISNNLTSIGWKWWLAIAAGCCAGIGNLIFNDGLMKTAPVNAAKMFVVMLIVQTSVPAIYDVVINQQLNAKIAIGFGSAIVAIICLI